MSQSPGPCDGTQQTLGAKAVHRTTSILLFLSLLSGEIITLSTNRIITHRRLRGANVTDFAPAIGPPVADRLKDLWDRVAIHAVVQISFAAFG
jgi:hypothetical protein